MIENFPDNGTRNPKILSDKGTRSPTVISDKRSRSSMVLSEKKTNNPGILCDLGTEKWKLLGKLNYNNLGRTKLYVHYVLYSSSD